MELGGQDRALAVDLDGARLRAAGRLGGESHRPRRHALVRRGRLPHARRAPGGRAGLHARARRRALPHHVPPPAAATPRGTVLLAVRPALRRRPARPGGARRARRAGRGCARPRERAGRRPRRHVRRPGAHRDRDPGRPVAGTRLLQQRAPVGDAGRAPRHRVAAARRAPVVAWRHGGGAGHGGRARARRDGAADGAPAGRRAGRLDRARAGSPRPCWLARSAC